ncbi:MAG TPA: hypothetical protein VFV70_03910 [Hyphomonadaceae bacterium]|nr:hypothetical protein [Hyphomonadaceae bacterium]
MRYALILALGTALSVGAVAALAQTPAKSAVQPAAASKYDPTKPYPAYSAPRLKIGQPDLQGFWANTTLTKMTRPAGVKDLVYSEAEVARLEHEMVQEIEEGQAPTAKDAPAEYVIPKNIKPEYLAGGGATGGYNRFWIDPGNLVMRVNGQPRSSIITTPNGQVPARKAGATPAPAPEQPEFIKLLGPSPTPRGGSFDNPETRATERCIISFGRNAGPPMFANGFYNNSYQIVQSPTAVMIATEMVHDARIVRLNSKHRTDGIRPYFGDSIGWFDGDTLVVETTNIPQSQQFMGSWKDLKVTERFKRVADDRLYYGFTVEDPTLWDAPWGGEYEFAALNGRMYEYACHEGNYAMHGILAGARVQEAKAAAEAEKAKAAAKPAAKPAKGKQ